MKNFYRPLTILFAPFLFLFPQVGHSSDVRVNAAGQLSLVMTDETTDLSSYNLGNPAGLALLPSQYRLQAETSWGQTTNTSGNYQYTSYGIAEGTYRGLMVIPGDGWAFQATGGLTDLNQVEPTLEARQYQYGDGDVRVAYRWGWLSLGTEITGTEDGYAVTFNNATNRATYNSSDLLSISGINLALPFDSSPGAARVDLGGTFRFLPGGYEDQGSYWSIPAAPNDPSTLIIHEQLTTFTPLVQVEVPKIFQGLVECQWNHVDFYENQTSGYPPYTLIPNYLDQTNDAFLFKANYLCRQPLSDDGSSHPWTFNHGFLFQYQSTTSNFYNTNGSLNSASTIVGEILQFGLGLERLHEGLLGLQFQETAGNSPVGADNLRLAIGGEWWATPHFALRAGITYLDDENTGPDFEFNSLSGLPFVYVAQQRWEGFVYHFGAGYEDGPLRAEAMGFYEAIQPSSNPTPNTQFASYGVELALAWRWGEK